MFLPALVFSSVIKTVTYATSGRGGTLQDVWVPITAAALIFIVAAVVTFPVVRFLLKEKEEFVRRAIWISLVLGNSNTLPLLVMNSICDCFEPLSTDPECLVRATGFSSLYTIVFTILTVSTSLTLSRFQTQFQPNHIYSVNDNTFHLCRTTGVAIC